MTPDIRIVYHCDDYGLTASVTDRIAEAWEAGLIDGFSVIANGDALGEAAAGLRRDIGLEARIAVHLNLFEGRAISAHEEVPAITDASGKLNNTFIGIFLRWHLTGDGSRRALLRQIESEWRRQIETVRDLIAPRRISALDGHLHMHMLPFLFPSVIALAREFGIEEIRVVDEPFYLSPRLRDSLSPAFLLNVVKNRILNLCVPTARACLRGSGIRTTDAFVGVLYTGRMSRAAAVAGIERAKQRGARSVELLLHIGRASESEASAWRAHGGSPAFARSAMRDREYEALRSLRG